MAGVGSSTETKNVVGRVAQDVADGAILGAGKGASLLSTAADIAVSAIPVVGEISALKDLYEGVRKGDASKVAGALIGLLPVAGGAVKALTKGGGQAVTKVGTEVAAKGLTNAALQLSRASAQGAKKAIEEGLKSPKLKAELAKAGERAFARATALLQERLTDMLETGKMPDLVTREHGSFIDARNAAFGDMGVKSPDSSWQALFSEDAEGKKKIVGKHKPVASSGGVEELYSALGFRFIEPDEASKKTGEPNQYQLMWWKHTDEKADPTFGVESFKATDTEAAKILDAYLNQSRSFRSTKRAG